MTDLDWAPDVRGYLVNNQLNKVLLVLVHIARNAVPALSQLVPRVTLLEVIKFLP